MHQLIEAVLMAATSKLSRRTELLELAVFGFADDERFQNPNTRNLWSVELLLGELYAVEPAWAGVANRVGREQPVWITEQLDSLRHTREWLENTSRVLREQLSDCTHCECPPPDHCCYCGKQKVTHDESPVVVTAVEELAEIKSPKFIDLRNFIGKQAFIQAAEEAGLKSLPVRQNETPLASLVRHALPSEQEVTATLLYQRALGRGLAPMVAAGYVASFLDIGVTPGRFLCAGTVSGRACSGEVTADGSTCDAEHDADVPRTPTGEAVN